jgi:lipopolysaccharide/colanic/teichoic acid biosynthesis glycosyltransferase
MKNLVRKFQNSLFFLFSLITYLSVSGVFFWIFSYAYPEIVQFSREAAVSLTTYGLTFLFMLNAYGALEFGKKQTRQMVYSLLLIVFFSDVITYIVIQIINPSIWNIWQFGFFSLRRLAFTFVVQVALIVVLTYLFNHLFYAFNPPKQTLVLYGSSKRPNKFIAKLQRQKYHYVVAKVLPISVAPEDLGAAILHYELIVLYHVPKLERTKIMDYAYQHKKTVYFTSEVMDVVEFRSKHLLVDDASLFTTNIAEFSFEDRVLKRSLDLVVASVGLVVSAPLWLIFALAIKLEDKGPIFFTQDRMTKNQRVFKIYKFRSMKVNVENRSVSKDDDRITKVGKLMRRWRIDELPQILNILKGDMSVVGPRAEMLENVQAYTEELPEFALRLRVKAGLTGYAQIYGRYNTSPKDKLIMDLIYIENYSIFLDIKLILQTLMVFLKIDDSTEGFDNDESE